MAQDWLIHEDIDGKDGEQVVLQHISTNTTNVAAPTSDTAAQYRSPRERGGFAGRDARIDAARLAPYVCHCVRASAATSRINSGTARMASRAAMITTGGTAATSGQRPAESSGRDDERGPDVHRDDERAPRRGCDVDLDEAVLPAEVDVVSSSTATASPTGTMNTAITSTDHSPSMMTGSMPALAGLNDAGWWKLLSIPVVARDVVDQIQHEHADRAASTTTSTGRNMARGGPRRGG